MYSYEDRIRAVRLYIKLGKSLAATVRQLGYPSATGTLERWHHAYEQYLDLPRDRICGSFENSVGNAAQRACALNAAKLSFPAMRNKTVRMVSKRAYPRALRFAA